MGERAEEAVQAGTSGTPALKRPLGVLDVWALGVGVVVSGAYFGWNLGLKDNGPVAMLVASLLVCLLYLTWVLALAELSVAMPYAGGPLAYGRRASGPLLGFVMGWSMLLEAQFAAVGCALGVGGYVAFLFNPEAPEPAVKVVAGLVTVLIFFLLQAWGVKEQSLALMVMTYGALVGLLVFWAAAATNFSADRVWPREHLLGDKGWQAVLDAVPYALWWLVMIETVALAAEEMHEPHRTLPRGLTLAQITLTVIVVLTWLFACGAMDAQKIAVNGDRNDIEYPLAEVLFRIPAGEIGVLRYGFGAIALFGLIASYHAILYAVSRQTFALGRAGYLPHVLGHVHAGRRTPTVALAASSLLSAGFVVANYWYGDAISVAVLVSTLTALVWYILAMGCLVQLRGRDPHLFTAYRAPVSRVLPAVVAVLSLFGIAAYARIKDAGVVFVLAAVLYAAGIGYYLLFARGRLRADAPEERAASGPGEQRP
jgi:ethanolamine permease